VGCHPKLFSDSKTLVLWLDWWFWHFDEQEFHGFWGVSVKLAVVGEINKKVSLFSFLSFFSEKSALSGRSKTKEIELISETLISKSLVGFW
jgi:hypothetical protein